jgi:hypothetical protein
MKFVMLLWKKFGSHLHVTFHFETYASAKAFRGWTSIIVLLMHTSAATTTCL